MKDWRIMKQDRFLKGRYVHKHKDVCLNDYNHEHCVFCFNKTKRGDKGWISTLDDYYWICSRCYDDFKGMFNLQMYNDSLTGSLLSFVEGYYSQFDGFYPTERLVKLLTAITNNDLFDNCIVVHLFLFDINSKTRYELLSSSYDIFNSQLLLDFLLVANKSYSETDNKKLYISFERSSEPFNHQNRGGHTP